jgi:DNA polymerase-3 subunit alpha
MELTSISEVTPIRVGDRVTVGGIIAAVKKITTKASNQEMCFVRLEDMTGSVEIVVFPKTYAKTMEFWVVDAVVSVSGKIDEKDERMTLLVDDVRRITA